MKMVLQNTNLNIRIPKKMKEKFIDITKEKGLTYSMVLRSMIKDYIASDGNGSKYNELNNIYM